MWNMLDNAVSTCAMSRLHKGLQGHFSRLMYLHTLYALCLNQIATGLHTSFLLNSFGVQACKIWPMSQCNMADGAMSCISCLLLCNNRRCCKWRPQVASQWFVAAAVVQDFAQTKMETRKFRFRSALHFGNAFFATAAALPCTMQRKVAALDPSRPCHSSKRLGADLPLFRVWV